MGKGRACNNAYPYSFYVPLESSNEVSQGLGGCSQLNAHFIWPSDA